MPLNRAGRIATLQRIGSSFMNTVMSCRTIDFLRMQKITQTGTIKKKAFVRATTLQSGHFANSAVETQFLDVPDSIGSKGKLKTQFVISHFALSGF